MMNYYTNLNVSGKMVFLKLIKKILSVRNQTVVLIGQTSKLDKIKTVIPRGSILGQLLFFIYINDVPLFI